MHVTSMRSPLAELSIALPLVRPGLVSSFPINRCIHLGISTHVAQLLVLPVSHVLGARLLLLARGSVWPVVRFLLAALIMFLLRET